MIKKICYGLALIMIFMFFTAISEPSAATLNFSVGTTYTFTISTYNVSHKVNGTEYITSVNSGFDATNKYTVTDANSTTVKLLYSSGGMNHTTYSEIDGFGYILGILVLAGALGFGLAEPGYVDFSAPTSTSSTFNLTGGFYPLFASGNVTYYQSLVNTSALTQSTNIFTDSSFIYSTNTLTATNSQSNNDYILSYNIGFTKTNTSQQFTSSFGINFKAIIDLTRNILTELYYSFSFKVTEDTASININMDVLIVEGTGSSSGSSTHSSSLGSNFISLIGILMICGTLGYMMKRRKY